MKSLKVALLALVSVPVLGQSFVYTKTITITDPDGLYTYSGQADFTQSGSTLKVLFTNIATGQVTKQRRVLTGVFFDLIGLPNVTANNATIPGGSSQINGGDSPANIADHWGFKQNIPSNQWGNAHYGISAVGLGVFSPGDTFSGTGPSLNGIDYGLVPSAGTTLGNPLVKDSMLFTLNLPVGYTLNANSVSNVWFQYGSDTSEFFFNVPEPATMGALGIGALALIARKRRKN